MPLLILLIVIVLFFVHSGTILRGEEKTIEFGGVSRSYRIHVPSRYDKNYPSALVIALHGLGDHPKLMELYTGLSVSADQKNFIVVYPYGLKSQKHPKRSWNGLFCCGEAMEQKADDVGFLKKLIDTLQQDYTIDNRRIFMTGFSDGAILTYRFAALMPRVLRAIAVVSGSMGGQVDNRPFLTIGTPTYPLPIMVVHGMNDPVIPYAGGSGNDPKASFLSVEHSITPWLAMVRPLEKKTEVSENGEVARIEFTTNGLLVMRLLVLKYAGHVWPGLMNILSMLRHNPHVYATEEIVQFFLLYK